MDAADRSESSVSAGSSTRAQRGKLAVRGEEKLLHVEGMAFALDCPKAGPLLRVRVDGKEMLFDLPDPDAVEVSSSGTTAVELRCGALKPFRSRWSMRRRASANLQRRSDSKDGVLSLNSYQSSPSTPSNRLSAVAEATLGHVTLLITSHRSAPQLGFRWASQAKGYHNAALLTRAGQAADPRWRCSVYICHWVVCPSTRSSDIGSQQ